ncbi:NADPH:quinone reductase [Variovorax ureilyticus]|uniref:NADPH:quinone reductase n=1 Tax=Variovorax ureilyticus TaxID=1836198 RepID=A0ABU8VM13_9BURK
MRVVFYTRQGEARDVLNLGDRPIPDPGPGEVCVCVRFSGVNPSDCKSRRGGGRELFAPMIIPHSDGAGVIDAVGQGVDPSRMGERVWIWNGQWQRAFGTAAEWIALPAAQAVPLPATLNEAEGACLGIPALTAMHAVRKAGAQHGQTVLVAGGAGSVGHYAIQMAKARGACVIATASTASKAAHARAAGADLVLDYRREDIVGGIQEITEGRGVDSIIEVDLAANAVSYPSVLASHGKVIAYGMTGSEVSLPALRMKQKGITLTLFRIYDITEPERAGALEELAFFLRNKSLKHTIALRLPLERVAEAHEAVERGEVFGRVLLDLQA